MRRKIELSVGDQRVAASAKEVHALAEGIVAFEIDFDAMVDLLGGIKPASSWQGGRIIGGFACGRRGSSQGPTAFEDTERALRALAPIAGGVARDVFGAPAPYHEHLGMVDLLTAARQTSAASMREVFTDAFRMVASAGRLMRTAHGSVPDWEATLAAASTQSLAPVVGRDSAFEAAQSWLEAHGGRGGGRGGAQGEQPFGAPTKKAEKRKARREAEREAKRAAKATATPPGGQQQQQQQRSVASPQPGGAPHTQQPEGAQSQLTTPGGGGGGRGAGGGTPLQLTEVPDAIDSFMTQQGTGAVEVFDRLLKGAGVDRARWPCGWIKVKGACTKGDCPRCKVQQPAGDDVLAPILKAVKEKVTPRLLKDVQQGAALLKH